MFPWLNPAWLDRAQRWYHTLRFLKPVQIYGRVLHALSRRFRRLPEAATLAGPAARLRDAVPLADHVFPFDFLGESRSFPQDRILWDAPQDRGGSPGVSCGETLSLGERRPTPSPTIVSGPPPVKLWRYHLNYFDRLSGPRAWTSNEARFLVFDWIARNPDSRTEPWEPFVISRRLTNWIRWLEEAGSKTLSDDEYNLVLTSIHWQSVRLAGEVEVHVQANHLLENWKSLVRSGLFLLDHSPRLGREKPTAGWLRRAVAGLREEIAGQILPDGGHYELSPSYHADILAGLAETARHGRDFLSRHGRATGRESLEGLVADCERVLPRMREWLGWMTHPDGEIALFNDAIRLGPLQGEIPPDRPSGKKILPASGFIVRRWGPGHYLACDANSPSPPWQPGHSHCDAMSFELSLAGQRIVVDTGCGSYQDPAIRVACRGTSGHNVPLVPGSEQSEMWGSFRVGRRSQIRQIQHAEGSDDFCVWVVDWEGREYRRTFRWLGDALRIEDDLTDGQGAEEFDSLLHLAPNVEIADQGRRGFLLRTGGLTIHLLSENPGTVEASRYYPEFGPGIPNRCIRWKGEQSNGIRYLFRWS